MAECVTKIKFKDAGLTLEEIKATADDLSKNAKGPLLDKAFGINLINRFLEAENKTSYQIAREVLTDEYDGLGGLLDAALSDELSRSDVTVEENSENGPCIGDLEAVFMASKRGAGAIGLGG